MRLTEHMPWATNSGDGVWNRFDRADMKDCGTIIAMFILMIIIAAVGMLAVK